MTRNQAGKRAWSPRGRPKSPTRHNGYSHAEGGVATSYSAFGAFRSRVKAWLGSSLLFAACLTASNVSVAQVTVPGTLIRNVANVQFQGPGAVATTTLSNEVSLSVQPMPSRSALQIARYDAGSQSTATAGPTQCRQGSGFVTLPPPALQGGTSIDPTTAVPLTVTNVAHAGE